MDDSISLKEAVSNRRTFAIISHPDAGKTTLTEKLLLYSGMIHTAGIVKGRKGRKAAFSDWMAMEQERGISITSSAMQFVYNDVIINVLDTPGHEDFSEDTYRTLTAADCAIMVIDAANGVEKQTRKLFEVCRLRKMPVLTFVNKMDMPGKDPLDLMHEVEEILQIDAYAMNWPIGSGKTFQGVLDRESGEALFFTKVSSGGAQKATIQRSSLSSDAAKEKIPSQDYTQLLEELELLDLAGNRFSQEKFLKGEVTPLFFASALTNFGVEPFFDAFVRLAPPPHARKADLPEGEEREVDPTNPNFSGYIFKIQANMDKQHRDNTAFIRICSGRFERDMVVKNQRTKKEIRLSRPHGIAAQERSTVDYAYPGDVIGVINPGLFAIGDTLTVSQNFTYKPLPQFQPEVFARIYPKDVSKRKAFDKAVIQLCSEGAIQMLVDTQERALFAAVGKLQFDVMLYRLKDEYNVETTLSALPYQCSAWIIGDLDRFKLPTSAIFVKDEHNRPMALFSSTWEKQYAATQNPNHQLVDIIT